jgi:hypothetical protein
LGEERVGVCSLQACIKAQAGFIIKIREGFQACVPFDNFVGRVDIHSQYPFCDKPLQALESKNILCLKVETRESRFQDRAEQPLVDIEPQVGADPWVAEIVRLLIDRFF